MDIQLDPNSPITYFHNDFSVDTYINSLSLYAVFNILTNSTGRQGRKYPIKIECSHHTNMSPGTILNYIHIMKKQFDQKINQIEVNEVGLTVDGYFRSSSYNGNTLIKHTFDIDQTRQVQFFVSELLKAQNQFYERAQRAVIANQILNNNKVVQSEQGLSLQIQRERERQNRDKRPIYRYQKKSENQESRQMLQRMREREQIWSDSLPSTYSQYQRRLLKERNKKYLEQDSQDPPVSSRDSRKDQHYNPYKYNMKMQYKDTKKFYEQIFIPVIANQWVDLNKMKNPNDVHYDNCRISLCKKNVFLFGKKITEGENQVLKLKGVQNVSNITIGICNAKYGTEFILDPFLFPHQVYFSTKGKYFNGQNGSIFEQFSVPSLEDTAIQMRVNLKGLKVTWTYLNGKRCSFDKIVFDSRKKIQWVPFIYFADSFSKAEIGI